MSFRYNMFGFHTGSLSVCILRRGKCVRNVWKKKGPHGKEWNLAIVVIPLKQNDRVGLTIVEDVINTPK